ncbi:hypothetical protein J2D73_06645 [Acetobacter sacchari]|uniref:Transposase n=1 Tax=Acetobacter sacchari TaxID=2661687 RepID=A0ABS3LU89_9PROT|nr:hypothetical protein [Acetobacter sacchari]MBO1359475.1 hypothetical protein [Acetobacter sacchari]
MANLDELFAPQLSSKSGVFHFALLIRVYHERADHRWSQRPIIEHPGLRSIQKWNATDLLGHFSSNRDSSVINYITQKPGASRQPGHSIRTTPYQEIVQE